MMNTSDIGGWFDWLYMTDRFDNTDRKMLVEFCDGGDGDKTERDPEKKIYDFSTACATIIGGSHKTLQKWLNIFDNAQSFQQTENHSVA